MFPPDARPALATVYELAPRLADERSRFLDELRAAGFRPRSVQRYDEHVQGLLRHLGNDATMADFTGPQLARYQRDLAAAGRASSTIAGALTAARKLARYLLREGLIATDPTSHAAWPKKRATAPRALSREHVIELWHALELPADLTQAERHKWRRNRRAVLLMLCAGLRIAEVTALCWGEVDLAIGQLTVRCGKGGKDRTLPLARPLADELALVPKEKRRADAAVVDVERGRPFASPKSLAHICERWLPRLGLSVEITAHQLRHTFATELLRNNVDLEAIRQLLGHASLETTQRYLLADASRLRGAVAKLGNW